MSRLICIAAAPARADQGPHGPDGKPRVSDGADRKSGPADERLRPAAAAINVRNRLERPPNREAEETERHDPEQDFSERLPQNGLKGALLIRSPAARPQGGEHGEGTDD
jgi:hypothetical protein